MNDLSPQVFLRSLKGAPLACLVALRWLRRAVGVGELAECIGYNRTTTTAALRLLAGPGFGYVENPGGYGNWRLSQAAAQLPLFTATDAGGEFAENFRKSGSSSSLINLTVEDREDKLLLPPPPEFAENLRKFAEPLTPDVQRIADLLIAQGCPTRRAQTTAADVVGRFFPAYVELELLRWTAYIAQRGKNINNPGAFLAAKLTNGERCPDVPLWENHYSDLAQQAARLERVWAEQEQEWAAAKTPAPQETTDDADGNA